MAITWDPVVTQLPRVTRPNQYDFTITVTDPEVVGTPNDVALTVTGSTFPADTSTITITNNTLRVQGPVDYMFLPIEGIRFVVWTTPGVVQTPPEVPSGANVYQWKPNPKISETFTITIQATSSMSTATQTYSLTAYNNWNADRLALLELLALA